MAYSALCCLLMVCVIATVNGTSLPVTEPPPAPSTTIPLPECFAMDGTMYNVGDYYNYDVCSFCRCTVDGPECMQPTCPPCSNPVHLADQCCPVCEETTTPPTTMPPTTPPPITTPLDPCYFVTCFPAQCSDAVMAPGDCCPSCPNGPDCRDMDTGELSPPGSYYVSVTGAECVCPESDGPFIMGYRQPMCRQITTTPPQPQGCLYDGQMYAPGQDFQPQACMWCHCDEMSMQAFCAQPSCMIPLCPKPVSGAGICCPTCPNGPACLGMDGDEILNGQTKTYPDGTECMCQLPEDNYWGGFELTAICTAPKPKSCQWQGQEYPEGQFQPDPCTHCECVEGQAQCYIQDCARPPCENPQPVPDQCCPVCPNGPDCMGRDGALIPAGSSVTYDDGEVCHCLEAQGEMSFQPLMPVCTMPTTTIPTTMPTTMPIKPSRRPRRLHPQQAKKAKKAKIQKRKRRNVSWLLSKLLAK